MNTEYLLLIITLTLLFSKTCRCGTCLENHKCVKFSECNLNGLIVYPCQYKNSNLVCCPLNNVQINSTSLQSKSSLLSKKCGVPISDFKISGGEVANYGQFPWMALLGYKMSAIPITEFLCGGTLITEKFVLTAAHCINLDLNRELVVVRLGEHNLLTRLDCFEKLGVKVCADPYIDIGIDRFFKHFGYNPRTLKNDIALIRLKTAVRFTDFIIPICLPINHQLAKSDLTGQEFTISGWGKTNWRAVGGSADLQFAHVFIWEQTKCRNAMPPEVKNLSDSQICANGKNQDACKGDSGGPLINSTLDADGVNRYYQFGIVSFSSSVTCGVEEQPAVYTRVDKFIDWIVEKVN